MTRYGQAIRWRALIAVVVFALLSAATLATIGGGVLASASKAADRQSPEAQTGEAREVTGSEVLLYGFIKPTSTAASYRFQWGRTRSYGHIDPRYVEEFFPPSETPYEVEEVVECLRPHTTYHYRVVAYSRAGVVYGGDRTFKTTGLDAPRSFLYKYCPGHKPVR
jgi:hypothetical protein